MSDRDAILVEAYLDGSLDSAQADELLAALDDPARGADIRRRLAFAGQLATALDRTPEAAVVRSVLERMDASADPAAIAAPMGRALPLRWRWRPLLLAAAAVLAAAVATTWWTVRDRADCRIAGGGSALVRRAGGRLEARPGMALEPGDRVDAAAPLALAWRDGSRIDLAPGTRLELLPAAPGRRLRLGSGALHADIAAQDEPLRILTPDAQVEVVGTRFRLGFEGGATRLEMYAGTVRLVGADGAGGRLVSAGETVLAAPTGAWRELFPAGRLDGWQARSGIWTPVPDGARGQADDTYPARIQSLAHYADLDLRLRLRVTGANRCEIQLGGYNWFFAVPAGSIDPQGWVAIELVQRGGTATCRADGVDLVREIAESEEPRPGVLAFYTPIGSTLEIAGAAIRIPGR